MKLKTSTVTSDLTKSNLRPLIMSNNKSVNIHLKVLISIEDNKYGKHNKHIVKNFFTGLYWHIPYIDGVDSHYILH